MTDGNTIDYYRRRERQEMNCAAIAPDPGIARIHLELAAHYQDRIRQEHIGVRLEMPPMRQG